MKRTIHISAIAFLLTVVSAFAVPLSASGQAAQSQFTASVTVGVPDTAPPSVPTGLSATAVSQTEIDLSWTASTDNVAVAGYVLYRDGSAIATTSATAYADTLLTASTTYSYAVQAFDTSYNYSALSSTTSTTTLPVPPTPPPPPPPTSASTSPLASGSSASSGSSLIYDVSISADSGSASISFLTTLPAQSVVSWGVTSDYEAGSEQSVISETSHDVVLTGLSPETQYYVRIAATAANGAVETYLAQFNTAGLPGTPLPNPSDFTASPATSQGAPAAALSWLNPSDPRVTGVRVVRSDAFFPRDPNDGAPVYEGSGQSFLDTGLVAGRTYYYAIFSEGADGLFSSGALTYIRILLPGQTASSTPANPFAGLPQAGSVDPQIASLALPDFEFMQAGKDLTIAGTSTIRINGGENLTIRLPYGRLPQILKTIAVTLSDASDPSKAFVFLLRADADKTYYEASIGALDSSGLYPLAIDVLDYQNQGLKEVGGSLLATSSPAPSSPRDRNQLWFSIVLLAVIVALFAILLARKRRKDVAALVAFAALSSAFALCAGSAPVAHAAYNPEINYQGKLTNNSNMAVGDGSYNIEFKLYTTPVSATSTAIWTEDDLVSNGQGVQTRSGLFSVMLGSTTPLAGVDFSQTLYLGVDIGGTGASPAWDGEMTPRKIIGAVPASFVSGTSTVALSAQTLQSLTPGQFFRTDVANATSSATTSLSVTQTGAGKIAEFFGSALQSVLSILSNGTIGIGTSTPSNALEVAGNGFFSGNLTAANVTATGTLAVTSTTTTGSLSVGSLTGLLFGSSGAVSALANGTNGYVLQSTGSGENWVSTSSLGITGGGGGTNYWTLSGSNLFNNSGTNVGIGTSTPSNALEVAGNGFFSGNLTAANIAATGTLNVSGATTLASSLNGFLQATNGLVTSTTSPSINALSGILAIANGGTNASAQASNGINFFNGTSITSSSTFVALPNGDVGVGTSTPSSILSVEGSLGASPAAQLFNVASSSNSSLFNILGTGDVNIPAVTPTLASSTSSGFIVPHAVYVSGRYMYVLDQVNGLVIFDVSNPASPIKLGSSSSGLNDPYAISVSGRYAYVTSLGNSSLTIFDVSDPASPVAVGSSNSGLSSPNSISVSGRYAYISSSGNSSLVIFDVSNPASPIKLGSSNSGLNSPNSVYVSGRYAYMPSNSNSSLTIFDVSNPASPVAVGSTTSGLNSPNSVYVSGRYAYVTSYSNSSLTIFDVSNPASPVAVGSTTSGLSTPNSVYVSGRYAYVTDQTKGFIIFDVSNPASPVEVGSSNSGLSSPSSVYVSGRYAYVPSDGNSSLVIFDLGGLESNAGNFGSLQTGNLQVSNDILAQGQLQVNGGLNVGAGGIFSSGPLAVYVASSTQPNAVSAYFQGLVGIGTSTPWAGLSLQNAFGSQLPLFDIATTTSSAFATSSIFRVSANGRIGIGTSTPIGTLSVKGSAGTNPFVIASSSNAQFLTLLQNGNFGIGTSTPSNALEVAGNGFFSGNLTAGNVTATGTLAVTSTTTLASSLNGFLQATNGLVTSTTSPSINALSGVLSIGNGGTGTSTAPGLNQLLIGNGSGGYSYIATSSLGIASGGTNYWTLSGSNLFNNSGTNVGIGTSTPSNALEVAGNGFFSGNLTAANIAATGTLAVSGQTTLGNASTTNLSASGFLASASASITGTTTTGGLSIGSLSGLLFGSSGAVSALANGTNGYVLQTTGSGENWVSTSSLGFPSYFSNSSATTTLTTGTILAASTGTFGALNATSTTATSTFAGGIQANGNLNIAARQFLLYNGASLALASTTLHDYFFGGGGALTMTGSNNTALGYQALSSSTDSGSDNLAVGFQALKVNTTGQENVADGASALSSNTTGSFNTASGYTALSFNTTGSDNSAFGDGALGGNTTGRFNVGVGEDAGFAGYGVYFANTIIGYNANYGAGGTMASTTELGYQAGYNYSGNSSTLLGYNSGYDLSSGNADIAIGQNVDLPSNSGSQQLDIGNLIYGTGVYGGNSPSSAPTAGFVGIGTSTPSNALEVAGNGFFSGNLTAANVTATGTLNVSGATTLASSLTGLLFGSSGAVSALANGTNGYVLQSTGSGENWVSTSSLGISGGGTNYFSNSGATTTLTTGNILAATTGTFGLINATSTTGTSTITGGLSVAGSSGLTVLQNGFVGIGTSTPSNALEVAGNGFFSGNLTAANVTATGTLNVAGQTTIANASTTNLSASGFLASASASISGTTTTGGLSIGSLSGLLFGTNGAVSTIATTSLGLGTVTQVSTDATLTGGPITNSGTLGLNLNNANVWTALQTFGNDISFGGAQLNTGSLNLGDLLSYNGANWVNVSTSSLDIQANLSNVTGILGVSNGGTGTSTAPGLNQLLIGNGSGGYSYIATSSLGIASGGTNYWTLSGSNLFNNSGTNVGIGTSTPSSLLSLQSTSGGASTTPLFTIASSTSSGTATTTLFSVLGNGQTLIGTTTTLTPCQNVTVCIQNLTTGYALNLLSNAGVSEITVSNTGVLSTNSFTLSSGNATCIVTAACFLGNNNSTVNNLSSTFGNEGGTGPTDFTTIQSNTSTGSTGDYINFKVGKSGAIEAGRIMTTGDWALGTSTAVASRLLISATSSTDTTNFFNIENSSGLSYLDVVNSGNVGIGTSTPSNALEVAGNGFFSGNLTAANIAATGTLNVSGATTLASSLTGLLFGSSGAVSALANGTNGYVLQSTGSGEQWVSTSSLGIAGGGGTNYWTLSGSNLFNNSGTNVGIGTSSPSNAFEVNGNSFISGNETASYFSAASTTATTTLSGGLNVGNGNLSYDWNGGITSVASLQTGNLNFDTDAGVVSWVDMPLDTNAASNTVESYTANLGGTPAITVYGVMNNSGALATGPFVGIGSSTPFAELSVQGPAGSTAPVFAVATTTAAGTSTTVFQINSTGNVGIDTTVPSTTLDVAGDISDRNVESCNGASGGIGTDANGKIYCEVSFSDARLKDNVASLSATSSLSLVNSLNPVSFYWTDPTIPGTNSTAQQFGFIAQDVQQVLPNLVATTSPTYLTPGGTLYLDYQGFIPLLAKAMQAQQGEIGSTTDSLSVLTVGQSALASTTASAVLSLSSLNANYQALSADIQLLNAGLASASTSLSAQIASLASTTAGLASSTATIASTTATALATSTPFIQAIAQAVENALQAAGNWVIAKLTATVVIANDIQTKTLEAQTVSTQTAAVTDGIEMTDQATGQIYCVQIRDGDFAKTPGECSIATTTAPTASSSPTSSPQITNPDYQTSTTLPATSTAPPATTIATTTTATATTATTTIATATTATTTTSLVPSTTASSSAPRIQSPASTAASTTQTSTPTPTPTPAPVVATAPVIATSTTSNVQSPATDPAPAPAPAPVPATPADAPSPSDQTP